MHLDHLQNTFLRLVSLLGVLRLFLGLALRLLLARFFERAASLVHEVLLALHALLLALHLVVLLLQVLLRCSVVIQSLLDDAKIDHLLLLLLSLVDEGCLQCCRLSIKDGRLGLGKVTDISWLCFDWGDRCKPGGLELNGLLFRILCLSVQCDLILFELDTGPIRDALEVLVLEGLLRRLVLRVQLLVAGVELDHVCSPDQEQRSTF